MSMLADDRDPASGATYRRLASMATARTVHVSEMIMVDVDEHGTPVGVEYAVAAARLASDEIAALLRAFPSLKHRLPETRSSRPRDLNRLAAAIVADVTEEESVGGIFVGHDFSSNRFTNLRMGPELVKVPAKENSVTFS